MIASRIVVAAAAILLAATPAVRAQTPQPMPSPSAVPPPSAPPSPAVTPAGPLSVSPNAVNLHPAQSVVLSLSNANGPVSATADAPLVQTTVDQTRNTVTVAASTQTGRTAVHISDGSGTTIDVPVRVALDAGTVPAQISLRVTGSVDRAWLGAQIQHALERASQVQPGAAAPAAGAFTVPALTPGSSAAVPVPVHIAGGDAFFDVDATANVDVQDVDLPAFEPPVLFYDDDPERIAAQGLLFKGRVSAGTPARLYYYHENTADPHRLVVVLTSATAAPATVQFIDSSAGPNIDVMSVGHAVTRDFLTMKPRNEGIVVEVPSGVPYVLRDFALRRLEGAAGNVGIRVVGEGAVDVAVLSAGPQDGAPEMLAMMNGPRLPGDTHNRSGVFDLEHFAEAKSQIAYTAGTDDASVTYGAHTPPSAQPGQPGHDYGEYGVLRSLDFALTNPSPQPTTVYLYERPLGGVVRSSFLLDGTLVQVGCARVSDRYQIAPIALDPNGTRRVSLLTMTDGGSNYPLEVGVTAVPPVPAAPPISAPDGCFPKPSPAPAPTATPRKREV